MMTTGDIPSNEYGYDEVIYERDLARSVPLDNYTEMYPSDSNGVVGTSKNGTYNIVSKDYGDHKVNYYIPKEYGDEYGISQLEDMSIVNDQPLRNPSGLVQRRMYPSYDEYDQDNAFEYVEDVPMMTPRTVVNISQGRHPGSQVITEVYEPSLVPTETVEYVYETQPPPIIEEQIEYVVEEPVYVEQPPPVPRTIVIQQPPPPPPPVQRTIFVKQPSPPPPPPVQRTIIVKQPTPPPPPPPPPVQRTIIVREPSPPAPVRSPRRKILIPRTPPPEPAVTTRRTLVLSRSPSPDPAKSSRRTLVFPKSPPIPTLRNTSRRTEVIETYSSRRIQDKSTDDQPPTLMEVVAQNRANRRGRVPKPKREVHEDNLYDLPTYHRNVIKNGFMVHK
ncbi:hypothetical protein I4U23_006219 [Adineta vaga]|nr:hypothetical protein I4U23_006219 [Adineta vaga]